MVKKFFKRLLKFYGVLLVLSIIFGVCNVIMGNTGGSDSKESTQQVQQLSSNGKVLKKAISLSDEQVSQLESVLGSCGLTGTISTIQTGKITNAYFNETDCYTGKIEQAGKSYDFTIYLKDGAAFYVSAFIEGGERELYAQNTVQSVFSDYVMDADEQAQYREKTINLVKQCLTNPATADFPLMDWNFKKNTEHYIISSYVESKNDFNMTKKNNFVVKFNRDGTPISVNVSGREMLQ